MPEVPADRSVFVGRSKELELVQPGMDRVEDSTGVFFLISGEAGIGKTALARRIIDMAQEREWVVMIGNCMSGEAGEPYQPFVTAIQRYIEETTALEEKSKMEDDEGEAIHLSMSIMGIGDGMTRPRRRARPTTDFTMERDRMFDTVSNFLVKSSRKAPVLFLLDDLQWAEKATLQLLYYLVRSLKDCRIMLLGAYRPEEIETYGARHPLTDFKHRLKREGLIRNVVLGRFNRKETGDLVNALARAEIPDKIKNDIHKETEGNPFYIEEFVKALMEQGIIVEEEGVRGSVDLESIRTPSTVSGLILGRMRDLTEGERKVLEYGAVVGQEFRYELLLDTSVVDEDEAVDALEKLMDLRILEEREVGGDVIYRFPNNLLREVVYNNLSRAKRRLMHKKVGASIESIGKEVRDIYALAYHFLMAGEMGKALDYCIKAGETAMASFASDEAMDYFKRALDMLEKMEGVRDAITKEVKLLLRMGQIGSIQGEWRTALRYFYEASRLCETDTREKAMAYREVGFIETNRADWKIAIESFHEALKISEKIGDTWGIAEAFRGLARVNWRMGDHNMTQEYGEKAIAEAQKVSNTRLIADAYIDMGNSFNEIKRDYEKSLEYYRKAMEYLDEEKDIDLISRALNNFGDVQMKLKQYEEAITNFEKVLELTEKTGDLGTRAYGVFNIGECLVRMGKHEDAVSNIQEAYKMFEKLDNRSMISMCHTFQGIIAGEAEDWKTAERNFELAIRIQEEQDLQWGLGITCLEYGMMLRKKGDKEKAREMIEMAIDAFQEIDSPKNMEIAGKELQKLDEM